MSDNANAIGSIQEAAQNFANLIDPQVDTVSEEPTTEEQSEVETEEEESVEEQDEAEDDSEEVESEEEESEEEPRDEKFVVKVDGKELEVTKDELLRGYQREADYTRKTQKLAEERKQVDSEFQSVRSEREQYAQVLGQLQQKLQELQPQEPDWDKLEAENPSEYSRQWTNHQRRLQQQQAVSQEQYRLGLLQQAEQKKHLDETLKIEAQRVKEMIPDWKDDKKLKSERGAVLEYGKQIGFSEQELNTITDSRAVVALYKAWKFDQLMSKKPELQAKIKKAPKLLAPSYAGNMKPKQSDINQAQKRLTQSGSVKDAASLFEKFM